MYDPTSKVLFATIDEDKVSKSKPESELGCFEEVQPTGDAAQGIRTLDTLNSTSDQKNNHNAKDAGCQEEPLVG